MRILVINGPNINMLGYGREEYMVQRPMKTCLNMSVKSVSRMI